MATSDTSVFVSRINDRSRSFNERFFMSDRPIKVFDKERSLLMKNATSKDPTVKETLFLYFNEWGSVLLYNGGTKIIDFKNPLVTSSSHENVIIDSNLVEEKTDNQKYFMCAGSNWVLYYDDTDEKFKVLYNYISSKGFAQYFKASRNSALSNLNEYCRTIPNEKLCTCFNFTGNDFCMRDLLGTETTRSTLERVDTVGYNSIKTKCHCLNSNCPLDEPIMDIYKTDVNECPSVIQITLCNSTINAGRDLSAGGINVAQNCKSQLADINVDGANDSGNSTISDGGGEITDDEEIVDDEIVDEDDGKKGSKTFIIIIIVIILVLLSLSGVGVVFYLNQ